MRIQTQSGARAGFGPAGEATLRKSLLADPETLAIVGQAFDSVAAARAEHEQRARKRVTGEGLPAQGGQTIDAFAEIDRLDGHEDPHVGSNLDHGRWRRKVCIRATRSSAVQ